MKNINDMRFHSPDQSQSSGKIEVTPEKAKELVNNLDFTKIENPQFDFPLLEYCPELKSILGDPEHNTKDALLALTGIYSIKKANEFNDQNMKDTNENYGKYLNNKIVNWDDLKKYGGVSINLDLNMPVFSVGYEDEIDFEIEPSVFEKMLVQKRIDSLHDVLGIDSKNLDVVNSLGVQAQKEEGSVISLVKEKLHRDDLVLIKDNGKLILPFNQEIPKEVSEQISLRYTKQLRKPLSFKFAFMGHDFEVIPNAIDNNRDNDKYLLNINNPYYLQRNCVTTKISIDGKVFETNIVEKILSYVSGLPFEKKSSSI